MGGFAKAEEEKDLKEVHESAKSITGNQTSQSIQRSSDQPKIGRNDMVEIEKDGQKQTLKYKKAESLIENEGWKLVR